MALKNTHQAGDPIKAVDINSNVTAILQNSHNILELFLENFFSAKQTPFTGLFFDGFSDQTKVDQDNTNLVEAQSHTIDLESDSNQSLDVTTTGIDSSDDLTVEAWINVESTASQIRTIAGKGTGADLHYILYYKGATGILGFTVFDASSTRIDTITSTEGFTLGTWHHVAGVRRKSDGKLAIYVEGIEVATTTAGVGTAMNSGDSDPFKIGGILMSDGAIDGSAVGVDQFDGFIDEVRVFNVFRTPAQVLADKDTQILGSTAGLIGYFKLNNSLLDGTANGNDLTNVGSAVFQSGSLPFTQTGNTSGQADILVADSSVFAVGEEIQIFDGSNLNEKIIQAISGITITLTTNLTNSFSVGSKVTRSNVNFNTTEKRIEHGGLGSADFDEDGGSSTVYDAPDSTSLSITGDMSVEFWVKILENAVADTIIVGRFGGGGQRAWRIGLKTAGNNTIDISIASDCTNPTSKDSTIVLVLNEWTHIAFTYDASAGSVIFYKNGIAANTVTGLPTSICDPTDDFRINAQTNVIGNSNEMHLSDVRIWQDIRTPAEISANFESKLLGSETDLNAYWKLESDALDSTANGNDFTTITNAPTPQFVSDTPTPFGLLISVYYSAKQKFQQAQGFIKLWVVRNFVVQQNLDSAIIVGASSLTVSGDQTSKYANGDTIDISEAENLKRERKTISGTPTFSAGVTTINFTPVTTNAFGISDFVERVDVTPQISIVNRDASESLQNMTLNQSIVDFTNSEVEDEFQFDASADPQEDFVVKLKLTRNVTTLTPYAKRLGVSLNQ